MQIEKIILAFSEQSYNISLYETQSIIESDLKIVEKCEYILVLSNRSLDESKAALAYRFNKTTSGVSIAYYNKHIIKPQFSLIYISHYKENELLINKLIANANRSVESLVRLTESNKND